MADEWRAHALGYAGDVNAHTPVIDRFASQSVNFEQSISGCSVCCPARASLITGQYPLTHGVYINDVPLEPKGVTLGEAFQNAGYSTGYIGKWHLYGSPDGKYERRDDYIPREKRFGFEYWKAAECCHDYNRSFYYEDDDPKKKYWRGYDAQAQTRDACNYIRARVRSGEPYFLVLSWGPPHGPLHTAPERYEAMYKNRELHLRPNVPANLAEKATEDLRGYYAHIAALDDCFKQLLETLESAGSAEHTIVVFTSDHGEMMESQGLFQKIYPWEESIRVPFLVRYPKKFGRIGTRSAAPLSSPDIMPTLLGLSGLPIPDGVQGTDYSGTYPVTRTAPSTSSAFLNLPVPITFARMHGFAEYRGVRNERYTYVRSLRGPWLLYDNRRDPYQMRNLCGQSEVSAVQKVLDAELIAWLQVLNDQFLPADDYLRRDHLTHYVETKFPIGAARSPWSDWGSTLPKSAEPLSLDSAIGDLLDSPSAKAILLKEIPGLVMENANLEELRRMSLRMLHDTGGLSQSKLDSIDMQLTKLPRE